MEGSWDLETMCIYPQKHDLGERSQEVAGNRDEDETLPKKLTSGNPVSDMGVILGHGAVTELESFWVLASA